MKAVVIGAVGSTEVLVEELVAVPGWELTMIGTLPPELHGRHSDIVDLSVLAGRHGVRLAPIARTNDPQVLDMVRAEAPDYVFVVGWSQICGPEFLSIAAKGAIGYHPAPLPRLRGRAAIPWTILLDEPISASSLFWIAEGTDDGDILAQQYFHLARDETAQGLYDKHMAALRSMLRAVLPVLAAGDQPRQVQDERYATWATKRTQADGLIDWRQPASAIDRLIRAVGRPYPGAFTHVAGRRITVWSSRPVSGGERHHALPGQVMANGGGVLTVQTGEGLIELVDWEVAEGRPPALHAVLKG
ncbi:methionyl-tRNA formyltransferase [Novosphingobium aerophilum]|uniref:methionyl-tRNA formyltransferase n=1 Tax=Novosphingobium TaxID=165696 RepID=UPI002D79A7E7|nr:formyltransferase family protein [Novosphingobium sp. RL4]WRT92504.1 formyltransferase family protein [Novosphingobium sp. RL4]